MAEISINIDELRKRKLFVGTPMYGGMCGGQYCKSIADLSAICKQYNIELRLYFLFNESLVTRARNYITDEFVRSDCSHMVFIDADIGFHPNDVISMLALADPDSDKDIIYGPYPKKVISWEKVKRAVDLGLADKDPGDLEHYVGDFVFNPTKDQTEINLGEPVETLEGGTGFMLIQKTALETYKEAYPELLYRPDHVRTKWFDGSREIMCYFDALIDNKYTHVRKVLKDIVSNHSQDGKVDVKILKELIDAEHDKKKYTNRYLSEDYMFCQFARDAGLHIWMCPWMKLTHTGTYIFGGSLMHLAQAGVSATANAEELNKYKKR